MTADAKRQLTIDDVKPIHLREMPPLPDGAADDARTRWIRPETDARSKSTGERLRPVIKAALKGASK